MAQRKVARGTVYLMAGQIIFLTSGYAVHVGLARYLGPETYGMYGVVISLLIWVELVAASGAHWTVRKYVAENTHRVGAIKRGASRVVLLYSGSILALVLALSSIFGNVLGDGRVGVYLKIAAFDIPLYACFYLYLAVMNGMRDFGQQAMSIVVYSAGKVAAIFILVFLGFSLIGAFVGNALASLFGLTVAVLFCKSYESAQPKGERIGFDSIRILKFTIPMTLLTLVHQLLMSLDLFCVKAIVRGDAEIGFYASAVALAKTPYFIFLGLSSTLFPSLAKSITEGDRSLTESYIRQGLRFLCVSLIPVALLVGATSRGIISLAFGDTYVHAAPGLAILIIGLTFFTFFSILSTVLIADDKPYLVLFVAVPLIVMDFMLNITFIPSYGIVGAAWATTVTTLTGMSVLGAIVFRRFRTLVDVVSVFRVALGSLAIYAIARLYQAPGVLLLVEYGVLLGIYVAVLAFVGEIKGGDVEAMGVWPRGS